MCNLFLKTHRPKFLCEHLTEESQCALALSKGEAYQTGQNNTSPHFLLGEYSSLMNRSSGYEDSNTIQQKQQILIETMIKENLAKSKLQKIFDDIDLDHDGTLCTMLELVS